MSSINNTATDRSKDSTTNNAVPDNWTNIPCVQYGFAEGEGSKRAPTLRTVFEPVPDGAKTASAVYVLTRDQYDRHQNLDNGYEIDGKHTSIATELQEECEVDDRVLYPIHIESDELHEVGPDKLMEWFKEFVEEYLEIPFQTCKRYFSGNRSIHIHLPRFVKEHGRGELKELVKSYCKETGAEFDCGIYSPKQLFRIPGVEHSKTGVRKIEFEGEWDNAVLAGKVQSGPKNMPDSYADVLRHVFLSQPSLTLNPSQTVQNDPFSLFQNLDGEKSVLSFETAKPSIETPLIEKEDYPEQNWKVPRWAQYNTREFSPYALATGGSRSVAVVNIKGTAFARRDNTIGNRSEPIHALIPSYFYGARGCAGEKYTKENEHAPLQLSKPDYEKWDYKTGDNVVIIGGKSKQSVIFSVDSFQASVVGDSLTGKDASRQSALDYLKDEGYDVGKAGRSKAKPLTKSYRRQTYSQSQSNGKSETKAARLQRLAEDDGIQLLSYTEISNVANRLLLIGGWTLAWEWLEEQFGEQFNPDETWKNLKEIVEYYDNLHATIPPKPN